MESDLSRLLFLVGDGDLHDLSIPAGSKQNLIAQVTQVVVDRSSS